MRYWLPAMFSLQLLFLCGCGDSVSDTESRERTDALFTEAVAAADRGDVAAARALYEEILTRDPTNGTVHLSLAMLLQDSSKDYIGAIYHYQRYLALQPISEKRDLVISRRDASKTLLTSELAASVVERTQQSLTLERDSLSASLSEAKRTEATLRSKLTVQEEELNTLRQENKELSRLVEALRTADSKTSSPALAENTDTRRKALLAAREEALKEKSSAEDAALASSDSIAAIRAQAEQMLNAPDGGQAAINAATREAAEGQTDAVPYLTVPTPGKKYLVRPGDTLSKLSREAYGTPGQWRRIRDANRSSTNPDGRLRAGEVILIP